MVQSSASLPVIASPTTLPTAAICPYLLAADERWRSSSPTREHRCTAVAPAAILSLEKQRRLCLAPAHGSCATFAAAVGLEAHEAEPSAQGVTPLRVDARTAARPMPRTAPIVMDHGRIPVKVRALRPDRGVAQLALLLLMVVAFAAIVLARVSAPSPDGEVLTGVSATRSPSVSTRPATSSATPAAPAGRTPGPSAVPTQAAATPAGDPGPAAQPATYTVRRGDTLSAIAAEFGTTVRALAERNGIDDPARIRIGQVLELP